MEAFVSKATAKDDVKEMIKNCLHQSHKDRKFKVARILMDVLADTIL